VSFQPFAEVARAVLRAVHLARAEDLPTTLVEVVAPVLGADEMTLYLIDYTQRVLVRFPRSGDPTVDELSVDGTLAGRAYRDSGVHHFGDGGGVWWIPLLDGTERLGVLKVVLRAEPDAELLETLTLVASLFAEVLSTRTAYGDAIERARRRLPMSVAAELQWAVLPPLTFAAANVVVSAALEPCYDIGGDSFDYSVNGDRLHAALFDAVGHGVEAARLAVFTVGVYRNARRCGLSLADTAVSIDRWVTEQYPGTFVTGVLLELDTRTGHLDYLVAGHPAPVLFRDQHPVSTFDAPTHYPFGLGSLGPGVGASTVLETGDRLLLYSDGIVEARSADGTEFGTTRLLDFLGRQLSAKLPAPETLRRLTHQILDYHKGQLDDDATAVLIEWSTTAMQRLLM
jgi:sigma-B regulation protein RsbU (phosphoserine phosphatase)